MLILTRKPGESIVIKFPGQDPVVLQVLDTDTGRARIGFEAPKFCKIMRTELMTERTGYVRRGDS